MPNIEIDNTFRKFLKLLKMKFPYKSTRRQFICKIPFLYLFILICPSLLNCKQLVDIPSPVTSTSETNVYTNNQTAIAVLTGIYANMSNADITTGSITSISLLSGLSADEITLYNDGNILPYTEYYRNSLNANTTGHDLWIASYQTIFVANSAIEGIENSTSLTTSIKQQLIGEAKFIRSFCYFYLLNLYGDVPLVLGTDYIINSNIPRSPTSNVYQQIVADLNDAINLLHNEYLAADLTTITTERVRPNKWAAIALLAKVHLYMGDYVNAEKMSTAIISNSTTYNLNTLEEVFLKNSSESIWQLQPVRNDLTNTQEARLFVLPPTGPTTSTYPPYPFYLNNSIVNGFEPGDQRREKWIGHVTISTTTYHFPYKYRNATPNAEVTEYSTILRLAEQYLIRAESRAQQDNLPGAQADLNTIRQRSGLKNVILTSKSAVLTSILNERRSELFTEWGHRWLDLKRTHIIDSVMSIATPLKGGSWNTNWRLYPIPLSDLSKNPNLLQNQGY